MSIGIFYTGCASTPNSIGVKNWTTGEVLGEISCAMPTGKETRLKYERIKNRILKSNLLKQ